MVSSHLMKYQSRFCQQNADVAALYVLNQVLAGMQALQTKEIAMKQKTILTAMIVCLTFPLNFALAQEPSSVGSFDSKVTTEGVTQKTNGQGNTQDLAVGSVEGSKVDGKFFTNVEVKGDITQKSDGSQNNQNLAVGSVQNSEVTGKFENKDTKTGAINQTISGGGNSNQQNMAVGSVRGGSSVKDFTAEKIHTGDLTQDVKGGSNNKQDMQIGSVNNSKVEGGKFITEVDIKNVTQKSTGGDNIQDIQIGSANNSTVGSFKSNVTVKGDIVQSATGSGGHNQSATIGSVR